MRIERCRICYSSRLETIKDLGSLPHATLTNNNTQEKSSPLRLVFCPDCLHLQIDNTEVVKSINWFSSGETRTMRSSFRELSIKLEKRFHLKAKDVVLDIGSNDGTFLRTFDIPNLVRVAVEKADELVDEAKTGVEYFIHKAWNARLFEKIVGRKAKLISALNVLEEVENPLLFLRDVEAALADDGVFLLQVTSLNEILEHNDIGIFSHEKIHYFSLNSLQTLLGNVQLEVFDMEKTAVGGHGIRLYCRKRNTYVENENSSDEYEDFLKREKDCITLEKWHSFFSALTNERQLLKDYISQCHLKGKKVWLYGLSNRTLGILGFLDLKNDDIQGVYDWQEKRHGLKLSLLNKTIMDKNELTKAQPDYLLLTPYHFINEFYLDETEARRSGVSFILPFPKFRVVN